MKINPFIIKWYHSFLTGRSELVPFNGTHSLSLTTNMGAPRDASVLHYTLYTKDSTPITFGNFIDKFADDYCLPIATLTRTSAR